jgi:hypothetical protein
MTKNDYDDLNTSNNDDIDAYPTGAGLRRRPLPQRQPLTTLGRPR